MPTDKNTPIAVGDMVVAVRGCCVYSTGAIFQVTDIITIPETYSCRYSKDSDRTDCCHKSGDYGPIALGYNIARPVVWLQKIKGKDVSKNVSKNVKVGEFQVVRGRIT